MSASNEAAFPFDEKNGDGTHYHSHPGMTLRDYFAAKAMQGICAHNDTWGCTVPKIATKAYELADAMLRAREQP